ncbi:MAG: EVE domain-containing protein [Proteobacteria bacterium]|nr:MAG: EVE domain-containing protein [Pseudomonadota bacterium]
MSGKLHWLMKTEPDVFGFDDLVKRPKKTEHWEGVRNYTARNFMRDQFAVGQTVFIYHSRVAEPAIVGIAEVVRAAYPDPTALDPKAKYFDEKSLKIGESRWVMVDVKAVSRFREAITLNQMKADTKLKGMAVVLPGQRLSIQPVTAREWDHICSLTELLPV